MEANNPQDNVPQSENGVENPILSDKEIEKHGYRDHGDYQSSDHIEPWIDGAKWARDLFEKVKSQEEIEKGSTDEKDILYGLALAEYCTESEREGFMYSIDNGCSLEKSNGYCSGFVNGFQKGYLYRHSRIAELERRNDHLQEYKDKERERRSNFATRIAELEAENKKYREALEGVKNYLSSKTVDGFEAYTIVEQVLKPKS